MPQSAFVLAFRAKPLLLDAGMGTRLMARGLDYGKDDPALWCLDRPEEVARIHLADIRAGSDALFTNTFGANRAWLRTYDRAGDFAAINRRAVELARQAAGPGRFVIGSIGPATWAGGDRAYREQASVLHEAGADALILETHDAERASAGLSALAGHTPLPILVSLHRWPEDVAGLARSFFENGAVAVGTNCGNSPDDVMAPTEAMAAAGLGPLLAKPSGGLPPVRRLLDLGVRLIGGCCGTDEQDIAAMRAAIDRV